MRTRRFKKWSVETSVLDKLNDRVSSPESSAVVRTALLNYHVPAGRRDVTISCGGVMGAGALSRLSRLTIQPFCRSPLGESTGPLCDRRLDILLANRQILEGVRENTVSNIDQILLLSESGLLFLAVKWRVAPVRLFIVVSLSKRNEISLMLLPSMQKIRKLDINKYNFFNKI